MEAKQSQIQTWCQGSSDKARQDSVDSTSGSEFDSISAVLEKKEQEMASLGLTDETSVVRRRTIGASAAADESRLLSVLSAFEKTHERHQRELELRHVEDLQKKDEKIKKKDDKIKSSRNKIIRKDEELAKMRA